MKKILFMVIMMLLAIMPLASADTALTTNLIRYEPLPAQPGQYVTVFIELQNTGNTDATNAAIEIGNQFPFNGAEISRKNIGTIKSQQSYVVDFKVRVDSQAVVGDNDLLIRYTPDVSADIWKEDIHTIRVQPTDASLSVTNIAMEPKEIAPGEDGTIQITVKNTADVLLRDISLQLGMVSVAGSTVVDLPFIPTNSVTEKRISRLAPDKQTILTYSLKAYPSATPGYYKLPLSMTFYDQEGTKTEKEDYIGVIVKAVPELKIYVEDNENLKQGEDGEFSLKFVNKGVSDLKFLDVQILPGDNYNVIGSGQAYIGDVDSDDYRTETFKINPTEKNVELQVKYSYKDENNVEFENTEKIMIDCNCSPKEKQNTLPIIIVVAIVLLFAIIIISRRKKRRSKKK